MNFTKIILPFLISLNHEIFRSSTCKKDQILQILEIYTELLFANKLINYECNVTSFACECNRSLNLVMDKISNAITTFTTKSERDTDVCSVHCK